MTQTDTPTQATPDHPAKWSDPVLAELYDIATGEATRKGKALCVLDPFAGVGRARLESALGDAARIVQGVELQELWVVDPLTQQGDATDLWQFDAGQFDAIFTSPCYGNRMADKHQANDPCKTCRGRGRLPLQGPTAGSLECGQCKGSGKSRRNTYAHELRRQGSDLAEGSAAGLQWGRAYRRFHQEFLDEAFRVVATDGLLVINMSNHLRPSGEQLVVEWWVNELIVRGVRLQEVRRVDTRRQRHGANGERRVDGEVIIVARTPEIRGLV